MRCRAALVLASCALFVLFGLAAGESAQAAGKVKVGRTDRAGFTVTVRAQRGQVCTVRARRGNARRALKVDMAGRTRMVRHISLRGRKRPSARVSCAQPKGLGLRSGQTVRVEVPDERLPSYITMERGGSTFDQHAGRFTRNLDGVWKDWSSVDITVVGRDTFSADFNVVLFDGIRKGQDTYHIGALDLRTLQVTDLTAVRQASGFGAKVLCEQLPGFLVQSAPRVRFGSDRIDFESGEGPATGQLCDLPPGYTVSSLSAPHEAAYVEGERYGYVGADGRGLGDDSRIDEPLTFSDLPSPDGAFVSSTGGMYDKLGVIRASDGAEVLADCSPSTARQRLLGWLSPRAFVVQADFRAGPEADGERAVAVQVNLTDDGTGFCQRLMPPTPDTSEEGLALTPDRKRLTFVSDTPSGPQWYELRLGEQVPREFFPDYFSAPSDVDQAFFEVGPQ